MSKYSDEYKLKVVRAYLEGALGYTSLAKAFNVSTESLIKGARLFLMGFGKDQHWILF